MNPDELVRRYHIVCERIRRAAEAAGRDPRTVRLLAVAKQQPATAVVRLAEVGQRAFAESYVQEAMARRARVNRDDLEWHFIGPLQGNKTRLVAEHFSWVHSVDRERIARRLSQQRPPEMPPLQVCIQVNVSGEASKAGVAPEGLIALAERVEDLPGLTLRGLMTLPARSETFTEQRRPFAQLRSLRDRLAEHLGRELDTLSMGMSGDLEAAVWEGADWVRIGTALFGPRPSHLGGAETAR